MADKSDKPLVVEDNELAVPEGDLPAKVDEAVQKPEETKTPSVSNPSTPPKANRPILKTVEVSESGAELPGEVSPPNQAVPSVQIGQNSSVPTEEIPQTPTENTLDVSKILEEKNPGSLQVSVPDNAGHKKRLLMLAVLIILILTGVGGFYYFGQNSENSRQKSPVQTAVQNKKTAPTKKPEVFKRSEWTIEVLNGTKISGLARKTSDDLIKLGYTVVKAGNADSSDYKKVQLLIQKGKQAPKQLIADMEMILNVSSVSGSFSDSTASARVIIGR